MRLVTALRPEALIRSYPERENPCPCKVARRRGIGTVEPTPALPMRSPELQLDEHELLRGIRAGDPEATRMLYERSAAALLRTAYQLLGDRDEAEDVLQEVFIGLPEALRRYEDRQAFEPWLRRVTVRVSLMRMRRERRRHRLLESRLSAPTPVRQTDRVADGLVLSRAIAALPETLRVVFVLREIEGYSHQEIAGLLGIRRGTSEVRFFRANRHLREILKEMI